MARVKVGVGDVRLGKPLTFAIYSAGGKLLLKEGHRIQTEHQLERLFAHGAFRDDAEQTSPHRRVVDNTKSDRPLISTANHRPTHSSATPTSTDFPKLPPAFDGFELSIEGEEHSRIPATFVGAINGQGLIISAPASDALQPGVPVHVRLLFGRSVYSFDTSVVARGLEVAGVVLLAYPQVVRRHMVRCHRRVQVAMPARVVRNDVASFDAQVIDISVDGIGLTMSQHSLELGEHFRLALRVTAEGRTHALMLNCIAQNVRSKNDTCTVGAHIRAATDETRAVLRALVFEAATGTTL